MAHRNWIFAAAIGILASFAAATALAASSASAQSVDTARIEAGGSKHPLL